VARCGRLGTKIAGANALVVIAVMLTTILLIHLDRPSYTIGWRWGRWQPAGIRRLVVLA
jgi:hypothetical protein